MGRSVDYLSVEARYVPSVKLGYGGRVQGTLAAVGVAHGRIVNELID